MSRTFLERLSGMGSIFIRDFTGEIKGGARMWAIPNPQGNQRRILELLRRKRAEEKLHF